MQELNRLLDEQPVLALEFVELDIRNQQAHSDLQSYNDNKVFLNKHDITKARTFKRTQKEELLRLKRKDPSAFVKEVANLVQNIRRIESNIRGQKYKTEEELESWKDNLSRARTKHDIMVEILND
ncbi:MAG: hypothetical protein JW783_08275 [Bacteroidales bacterium]|nr:hypothetical protein [Bacteroidales bacterium]MBN2749937.1 hypothetical protein [Bacteroidales bacterium]